MSTSNDKSCSAADPKLRFCEGRNCGGKGVCAIAREAIDLHAAARAEVGKLIRSNDPQTGAGLFDPRYRVPQIVVLLQCRANQILQLLVFEDVEPFEIGDGCRFRGGSGAGARKAVGTEVAGRV